MTATTDRAGGVRKLLSANDAGDTGSHQAGILVPKDAKILSFFPVLDGSTLNPRAAMIFVDDTGESWRFVFIYYNNRRFGGTRNEYRLTHLTGYIRHHRLHAGDSLILSGTHPAPLRITHQKGELAREAASIRFALGDAWEVIPLGRANDQDT